MKTQKYNSEARKQALRMTNKALLDQVIEMIDDENLFEGDQTHIREQLVNLVLGHQYRDGEEEDETRARILSRATGGREVR